MEYVEIDSKNQKLDTKKQLYMDNEYPEDDEETVNEIENENKQDSNLRIKSTTTRASKRPIQRTKETLDIEPLEEKDLISDNQPSKSIEIDDPW